MNEERSFHQISDSDTFFTWGASTHVGNIRTQNQDYFGITNTFIAVADGMGGHNGGEVASETAIKELLQKQRFNTVKEVADQVILANRAVNVRAQENPNLIGMGTTLCAISYMELPSDPPKLVVVNVGDSRVFVLAEGKLQQITQDHSLVEEMYREGKITKSEAENHPRRNVITRSLGTNINVDVDCWEITARKGDRYLLCTDGLTNEVSNETIFEILQRCEDPQKASEALIENAVNAEGLDNVTAVVVDIKEGEDGSKPIQIPNTPTTYGDLFLDSETQELKKPEKITSPNIWKGNLSLSQLLKLFIGLIMAAIAIGSLVGHYAREGFFVAFELDDDTKVTESQVVIYKGTKGGVLWFEPTIEKRTVLLGLDLNNTELDEISDGVSFDTFQKAQAYIDEITSKDKPSKPTG